MRFHRILCLSLWLCATPLGAQTVDSTEEAFALAQGGAVPPYVVPVLRLVSKTHVEPTTGLVLSASGLVLVPAGFASTGDEIVVLDGGTDIVSNGRTARIERNFPMDGLQVLSVYGLQRPGVPFADSGLSDGDEIRLAAFPPAEQIAEGAQPLDAAATVTVFGGNRPPAVSGDTPLPNVTGPLLDSCGNVVAFSVANDLQTMETSPGTRYQWRDTLLGVMDRLGVQPATSACVELAESLPEDPVTTEPEPPPVDEPEPEAATEPETATEEILEEEPTGENPAEETLDLDILPPIEVDEEPESVAPTATVEPAEPARHWPWLLLAALLIASGVGLHAWRRAMNGDESGDSTNAEPLPADEDIADGPAPGLDSRLQLSGQLADGTAIETACPVAAGAVNVVIGRGQADLVIASTAVSRRHAALNGSAGALTFTDLGSANGSSINGVPCLEGEIMYLEPGDTLVLGDARFTLQIQPASGDEGE